MNTRRQEDMAKYSNTVEYNIRTTLDNSGIAKLQSELTQLQNKVNTMGAKGLIPQTSLNKTLSDIKTVQTALTNAFNPKLGMLNTTKFMNELKTAGLSMNQIYQSFSNAGAAGTRAFTSFYGQVSKIDTGLRSISKTTDKIINTMGNTFRWGVIASAFAGMMNSVHQAAQYTQDLDKSLTNIMMVSGETRENMNAYARIANEVAQKLGSTTVAMTDATQVFIQQGYDLQKSQQLAQYSTVLGNVSQQDTKTASDEITAYMNAYKIPLEDIGNALSK
jgi:cysteinyl-tRNA synthetase